MPNDRIKIKGTSNGLVITLGAGAWPRLVEELDALLGERASFFKGGRVALRVGARLLSTADIEAVGQVLSKHHVTLWAVESEAEETRTAAAELGLEVELEPRPISPEQSRPTAGDTILIRRTLRSGQVVEFPGNVVVIGDVNPGAEIRAGGNVVVWGRLRGAVHAGMNEELGEMAVVCALDMSPSHLRIGDYLALSPADDSRTQIVPEMAFVHDRQIVAEPWSV
ncbi:MAG: septum site-determining protein MinC [Chloroflexi bacterium]|nr:MAG: septum site-determining protein MinC [Chloroflexota bacterium]